MKWSDIGVLRYESLFESLSFIDTIWNACRPLPTIIITLNVLYYFFMFLDMIYENHESLPDRLQETENKLDKAEAQIQETKLAHETSTANFKQAQQNFDITPADHFADMTKITTRYLVEKEDNTELFTEVSTLRKAFAANKTAIEQLQVENKRLNIRLVSPTRRIRPPPITNQGYKISNAQSSAEKQEFTALQMKFNIMSKKMEQLTKTSRKFNSLQDQSTKISTLEADCKIKDGKITKLGNTVQIQTATISKLEKAAHSHTTKFNAINSALGLKDKEIEHLKQRPNNNADPNDHKVKSLESQNDAQKSTIASLKADLDSANEMLSSQSKTHLQAINDKTRIINELDAHHTANLAQKETEKASALEKASDALALVKQEHTATLLRKDDEIKAARTFFALPVQNIPQDNEITSLKAELAKLRETFNANLANHKEELTLHFDTTKELLLQHTTAAVWEEAEKDMKTRLQALDDQWSSTWDTRVSKYELDWKTLQDTLAKTTLNLSTANAANAKLNTKLQSSTQRIKNLERDLQTSNTAAEKINNELMEVKLNIIVLEASIVEWEGACEDFEKENLKLERKVKELGQSRQG